MPWVEVFALFTVCHLVGDYLLQTDWQATNKRGGLSADAVALRALLSHVATYTLAFAPALLWVAGDAANVLWMAAVVALPHAIQDDGRIVEWWMKRVKRADMATQRVAALGVDQTLHMVALLALALIAGQ